MRLAWLTNRAEILTRDFLPGLVPYVRWLRTPLGSLGSAAVASGLCGLFLHPQGFVVFFGLLAVMALGVAWPWLSVRGLSGSLASIGRAAARGSRSRRGSPSATGCPGASGASRSGRDSTGRDRDGGDDGPRPAWPSSPAGGRSRRCIEFVPDCRGEYPDRSAAAGLRVPVRPAGGVAAAGRRGAAAGLAAHRPRRAGARGGRGVKSPTGWRLRDRAGHWGDPLGVRPYRRGDPLRRVHWGLSAAARRADRPRGPVERRPARPDRARFPRGRARRLGAGRLARVGDPRRGQPRRGLDRAGSRGRARPRGRLDPPPRRIGPGAIAGRARCAGAVPARAAIATSRTC